MIFDALVVGHVRDNLQRAALSIIAIALGVATALALWLASSMTLTTLNSDRSLFANHVDFQIMPLGARLPANVYADVRYVEGVASADPIIDQPIVVGVDPLLGSGGTSARLIGVDLLQPLPGVTGYEENRPGPFAAVGTFIDPAAVIRTNGAVISTQTAARLHLRRGSRFTVLAGSNIVTLRVANVLPSRAQGVDSSVVFVDFTTAQAIFHYGATVDRVDILTNERPERVRPRLVAALAGRARLGSALDNGLSLADLGDGIDATFGGLAAIALLLGGLLVFNAVGTSITHRRGDIGTLRALGVRAHQIVAAFVLEGAGYGFIGAILGIGVGVLSVDAVAGLAHAAYEPGPFDVWPFVGAFFIGLAVAVVSSIVPAFSALAIAPALAVRRGAFEGPSRGMARPLALAIASACFVSAGIALAFHPTHYAAFVLGLPLAFGIGGMLAIPALLRALGTLARRLSADAPVPVRFAAVTLGAIPKRLGVAVAALAIATYAAVAFDVASTSLQTALETWAAHGIAGDLLVQPAGIVGSSRTTFDRSVLVRVQATPGVRAVAAIRTLHTLSGATDVALRGDDDFVPVPQVESTEAPAQLSSKLAVTLHVRRGDTIDVRSPRGSLRLRIVDVRPDFSSARGEIVVARRVLRDAFNDDRIDALRVTIDKGIELATVRTAISRNLAPRRLLILPTREIRDRLTGVFAETFAFTRSLAILVVAIAALGVASVLAALVSERRFELSTLRHLGAKRGTIAEMLILEALTIALAGSVLGMMLGAALAAAVLDASDPVLLGFSLPMTIPFARVALVISASVGAAVLGTIVALPGAFAIATDEMRRSAV